MTMTVPLAWGGLREKITAERVWRLVSLSDELGWSIATLSIGVLFVAQGEPPANHALSLMVRCFPTWLVAGFFIASGIFSIVGIAFFFVQGRCFLSRHFRLIGSALGTFVWTAVLFADGRMLMPLFLWAVLVYLRCVMLVAYRRF